MMARSRDKHQRQQPAERKVMPEPGPGFDPGAYIHSQMTLVYNNGVLRFGTADKFLMVTKMESIKSVLQNLEGSMEHNCYSLDDILKTEPDYLQRIGLMVPPGHGYARYTMYDLSQPEYPGIAAWFNPLVTGSLRWIPGDQPAANRYKTELLTTNYHSSYKEWSTDVLQRIAPASGSNVAEPTITHPITPSVGATLDQLKQALAGVKIEEDSVPNDYCLSKVILTPPDGTGAITTVVCTQENFNRAIDLLEGVYGVSPGGEYRRTTAEDLQLIKDDKQLPDIARGVRTEPLFKMFSVSTSRLTLVVEGLASRMGVPYPPGCK
jgi:hypothetical protein